VGNSASFGFYERADFPKIILQRKNHGTELFQKVLGAEELDHKPRWRECHAGWQLVEACAQQLQGAAVRDHPDMLRAGRCAQLRQAVFQALASAKFRGRTPGSCAGFRAPLGAPDEGR